MVSAERQAAAKRANLAGWAELFLGFVGFGLYGYLHTKGIDTSFVNNVLATSTLISIRAVFNGIRRDTLKDPETTNDTIPPLNIPFWRRRGPYETRTGLYRNRFTRAITPQFLAGK